MLARLSGELKISNDLAGIEFLHGSKESISKFVNFFVEYVDLYSLAFGNWEENFVEIDSDTLT